MPAQPQERIARAIREDAPLHVVLVEPEIPPNTGNVARMCAATGCQLHLVEPLGFGIGDRELKRAGLDYWEKLDVMLHASLGAFLRAAEERTVWLLSTRAKNSYANASFALGDMLVFGPETRGLPAPLLEARAEHALRIPQRAQSVRSLNLSTAAGIVTYAALARLGFPGLS